MLKFKLVRLNFDDCFEIVGIVELFRRIIIVTDKKFLSSYRLRGLNVKLPLTISGSPTTGLKI